MNYVMLFGLLAFLSLLVSAAFGHLAMKGKVKMKFHFISAGLTILFAFVHLGLIYF